MPKEEKTNVMRMLERAKLAYTAHAYPHGDVPVDGVTVAGLLGQNPDQVFKTLVTRGASREYHVFLVPVARELSLKSAARAVGEKSVEMIHVSEITKVTGYVRGGCSPIGMKKLYSTVVDESCLRFDTIVFSAGKIGMQIEMNPRDLLALTGAKTAAITE